MVIAVDIRFSEGYQHFIFETFKRITAQHPQHSFLFIFDKPFNSAFIFSDNVTTEVIKQTRIQLLSKLNNENKISTLLKKHKADIFITQQPIKTNVPQCFVTYDKITASYLKRAKVVIADSEYSKKEIAHNYKISKDRIEVVYYGADNNFQSIAATEREEIKEQYAEGNEFFLISGATNTGDLLNVLKAFSVFKKMQKSNMHLLITPKNEVEAEFLEKLKLFKYNDEVTVVEVDRQSLIQITAAAYAFIYPVARDGYSVPLEIMKSGIPVITANEGSLPEVCGDAALYVTPGEHKDIADKMILVYKDEKLRSNLVEKGKQHVKKYSWDETANAFWRSIAKGAK